MVEVIICPEVDETIFPYDFGACCHPKGKSLVDHNNINKDDNMNVRLQEGSLEIIVKKI